MIQPVSLRDLRDALSGAVLAPDNAGYDARRSGWNRRVVHRPAAIVVARGAADVAAAAEFTTRHGLELIVQATGHGPIRLAGEDALLVDVAGLDEVRVDECTGTATVGGGARWTALQAAAVATRSRLVAVAPAHAHVGVTGSALVGGFGWLARAYGMSRDHVIGAEMVMPGGELIRVTTDHHPELLWALRGGGAPAPGVVTSLTVGLVTHAHVYAGELRYPAEMALEVMARYGERVADVPPGLTSTVVLSAGPPAQVIVRACHAGPIAEGRAWVDDWRRWSDVGHDRFTVRPASAVGDLDDEPAAPTALLSATAWLRCLGDDLLNVLTCAVLGRDASANRVEVRHVGGAIRAEAGPFPHDTSELLLRITARSTPAEVAVADRRLTALHASVVATGSTTSGVYPGFAGHPAPPNHALVTASD